MQELVLEKLNLSRKLVDSIKIRNLIYNESIMWLYLKKIGIIENSLFRIMPDGRKVKLIDTNYMWLKINFDNEDYSITAIFNEKMELVECNFDINLKSYENNIIIPSMKNFFINIVISADGRFYILNENLFLNARKSGLITTEEYAKVCTAILGINSKYYNFGVLKNACNEYLNYMF